LVLGISIHHVISAALGHGCLRCRVFLVRWRRRLGLGLRRRVRGRREHGRISFAVVRPYGRDSRCF